MLQPMLIRRVASIASSRPAQVALRAGAAVLRYSELDANANRLACYLGALALPHEAAVAICLPRSFEQVIASLAVMKAGGAFLPLDPSWPTERLRALLEESGATAVITDTEMAARLSGRGRMTICADRDAAVIRAAPSHALIEPRDEDLAYILYTSGSTGTPKGVEITHGNLDNLIRWHCEAFDVTEFDRASHLAGLGFDAAVWEIWPYLFAGASVSLAPERVRTAPVLLQRWLVDEQITIGFVPTALAEPLLVAEWPAETKLRLLLTGADTLRARPPAELPFRLVNNYGPTECAVVATSCVVSQAGEFDPLPPIGRAIAGVQIHLLDAGGRHVPTGEIGEIFIGGAGVGRGYRNRPELTAASFLPDPFADHPDARLYRTGDFGRVLPDGQILFCGRADDQEKIRGHRIEPNEIAAALNRHPLVACSTVVARACGGDEKQLVAYILPAPAGVPTAEALRALIAEQLPAYMVPTRFVRIDALPLNSSGKLDKDALAQPSDDNALDRVPFRAPATPLEARLAAIVAGVLGTDRVGADDNFFLLGGHSLLGTQVVLRIRDAFGIELTLWHLFQAQTVANLAGTVETLLLEQLQRMSEQDAQQRLAS
ncbi:MAG: amino acid adenylation protein [Rhodospirillales bacterium]|nr:amino acid adenylation protein [Rhodospirillales bacterium]